MIETTEFVDLSYAQKGNVIWNRLAEFLGAVAIRMSQDNFIDSEWVDHSINSLKAGMPFFGWAFVQPDQGPDIQIETALEAWNMLKTYKPKCIGFDVEDIVYTTNTGTKVNIHPPSRSKATLWLMQLIEGVRRGTGLSKKACVIYTRKNYWDAWIFPSGTKFEVNGISYTAPNWDEYSLWIAAWVNYTADILLPVGFLSYLMHQYEGGSGRVPGAINGPVDRDRFNPKYTYAQMIDYIGKPPEATVTPAPVPVTIPYTATTQPSFITVKSGPGYSFGDVAWPAHGTPVTVTEEVNGWAHIANGWVSLTYSWAGVVYQSLENKVSVKPPDPVIPPVIPPVVPPTVEQRLDRLEAAVFPGEVNR